MTGPERIGNATLYLGDCMEVIPQLSGLEFILADPPYSSGGQFRGDRAARPSLKYVQTDSLATFRGEFSGDTRDQRAFLAWASMWLGRLYAASESGAALLVFTDWRQLPTVTDAVQCGGWVWRNLVTWWKPGIRMQRGRFSLSAEYAVYASRGSPREGAHSPQNVLVHQPVPGDEKSHIAEKPLSLIAEMLEVCPARSVVCDPFMGSGTTAIAALKQGHSFVGIEMDRAHFDAACRRVEEAYRQGDFLRPVISAEQLPLLAEAVS